MARKRSGRDAKPPILTPHSARETWTRRAIIGVFILGLISPAAIACTNFMATDGTLILFGDSEDGGLGHDLVKSPDSAAVFFMPRTSSEHGRMHLGWLLEGRYRSCQAGMNERGLAYGLTSVPNTPLDSHPERPYSFTDTPYFDRLLALLETVDEVIEYTMQYSADKLWFQAMFVDAKGDAVVIGPGEDGDFAFTRKEPVANVFTAVSTINLANPPRRPWSDAVKRRDDANAILRETLEEDALSPETFARALDAVHRDTFGIGGSYTMYSTTYDLTHRVAHVYFMSQFDEVVEIDLAEELAKGSGILLMSDLFSDDLLERAFAQFHAEEQLGRTVLAVEIAAVLALLGAAVIGLGILALNLFRQ